MKKNNTIIIDNIVYDDGKIIDYLSIESLLNTNRVAGGYVKRFILDMRKPSTEDIEPVQSKVIYGHGVELPRFNQLYHMKEYRYFYAVYLSNHAGIFDSLVKVDTLGSDTRWQVEGTYPSEPIFIPNPYSKSEDDGVLLSVVLDTKKKDSFLVVIDAKSMNEIGRATASNVIPFGFHGNFFGKNIRNSILDQ